MAPEDEDVQVVVETQGRPGLAAREREGAPESDGQEPEDLGNLRCSIADLECTLLQHFDEDKSRDLHSALTLLKRGLLAMERCGAV